MKPPLPMDGPAIRREGLKRGIYLLPNLCTAGNLFCGFYSVVKALHHEFEAAAWGILAAGLFDFLDGRVARLTQAESEFGIEFDSLVDLVSFGVAPGILVYTWSLAGFDRIGWLVAFLFIACGALRLARFNVQVNSVERTFFQGLPIPVAADAIATTVVFHHYLFGPTVPARSWFVLAMTVGLSLVMVSTIRYRSFKQVDFRGRWSFFSLVGGVGLILIIASEPAVTLFCLVLLYVAAGLLEEAITMRKGRQMLARVREKRAARRAKRVAKEIEEKVHPLNIEQNSQ